MKEFKSELDKPLKAYASRKKSGVSNRSIIIGLACTALVTLPVAQFYGVFDWLGDKDKSDTTNQEQVAIVTKDPDQGATAPKVSNQGPVETGIAEGDGELVELKPDGEIVPPVPKPKPTKKISRQKQILAHLPDPELIERVASGVIPKRSSDGLRPMDFYSRQPDTEGNFGVARVVIVIGGMGISQTTTQKAIRELPGSVTLAFAPYGNSLARWMQLARKSGHELLLQVPMEPISVQEKPGDQTLLTDGSAKANLENLHWSMSRITNYVGVMNYLGNKFLTQPSGMGPVFNDIAERGLLFFEDGSVPNSIGEGMAVRALLPYAKANIQLDRTRTRAAIAGKLNELMKQAKRTGLAIGVGNAFPETVAMVGEFARKAKEHGIEITPVSAVVKDPDR